MKKILLILSIILILCYLYFNWNNFIPVILSINNWADFWKGVIMLLLPLAIFIATFVYTIKQWKEKKTEKYFKLHNMFINLKSLYQIRLARLDRLGNIETDKNEEDEIIKELYNSKQRINGYICDINNEVKQIVCGNNKDEIRKYLDTLWNLKEPINEKIDNINNICKYILNKFNKKYVKILDEMTKNKEIISPSDWFSFQTAPVFDYESVLENKKIEIDKRNKEFFIQLLKSFNPEIIKNLDNFENINSTYPSDIFGKGEPLKVIRINLSKINLGKLKQQKIITERKKEDIPHFVVKNTFVVNDKPINKK